MRRFFLLGTVLCSLAPAAALGATPPGTDPDVTFAVRETFDAWRDASGGLAAGGTALNKLQIAGTWTANNWRDPGFRLHFQIFNARGAPLSAHVGDLQTVSNIEAVATTRLFEAWAEQSFGKVGAGGVVMRAGLVDLNSDFDSIAPAALFVNSSHGIGPDLSKSGRNGPSIFPVSSAAVRLTWTPNDAWTVRTGVFDGVPGDPQNSEAFAAVRLGPSDGVLGLTELDRKVGKEGQVSFGVWSYSSFLPRIDGLGRERDRGVFGFVDGRVPGLNDWIGWVRAGVSDPDVQVVSGYVGAGLVRKIGLAGRRDDRLGFAVSHATISSEARRLQGLNRAETTWEATYQVKAADWMAVQPDVQYVVHPSSRAGIRNALVFGVRLVITAGYPRKAPATEQADPTVPPDNPADPPPT